MSVLAFYDVPAPAKLNLFLHVVGRRADGHHLLQSVFVPIDWADTLHFERRDDGLIVRHDLSASLPADDLCLRAARCLQAASACRFGADISIDKQVPWGAGLGGGSSDAATTLLALNRLWGLNWPRSKLLDLALPLGADVPFFIGGTPAWVEGIGEQLTPFDVPSQSFALIKPQASLETRAIFTHPQLARDSQRITLEGFDAQDIARIALPVDGHAWGRNDLQPVAELLCPAVRQAADELKLRFGNSRMSGSGSTVFARLGEADASGSLAAINAQSGWISRICRSLQRHPLYDWVRE
jgi:4-diphosphocytidyl-2-C-methyl-D-erythritol kinase